jgi:hypothetical protein
MRSGEDRARLAAELLDFTVGIGVA